jgi:hypothetical protein
MQKLFYGVDKSSSDYTRKSYIEEGEIYFF